jgi:hypothetical protein
MRFRVTRFGFRLYLSEVLTRKLRMTRRHQAVQQQMNAIVESMVG